MRRPDRARRILDSLQGKRPRRPVPGGSQPRRMTLLQWVLGTLAAAPLGLVAALVLGPDALGDVSRLVATFLLQILHSVRDLFVK